jgi:hypothetical protein
VTPFGKSRVRATFMCLGEGLAIKRPQISGVVEILGGRSRTRSAVNKYPRFDRWRCAESFDAQGR